MGRPCREETCRKVVVFAKDKETGKLQVLSNAAPMWRQCGKDKDGTPLVERVYDTLLSHFVDCTKPSQFSRKQESPPPERHFSEPAIQEDRDDFIEHLQTSD